MLFQYETDRLVLKVLTPEYAPMVLDFYNRDRELFEKYENRFGKPVSENTIKKARELQKHGLVTVNENSISLTVQGFLVSNSVITALI